MNTQVNLERIFKKVREAPHLESSLLGIGTYSYAWYRFRYFILSSFLFYFAFFIKMYFLGEQYTSFYTSKILVFEQFVFWFAQIFWYLIILAQKEKESLQRLKFKFDIKISIIYSLLVSLGIGYFLYRQGLLVFERLTVYGAVSFVFLAQIFIAIYLKYLHSHIYAFKRIFINMPLIIFTNLALLVLQIVLWSKYMFWSVPLVFGAQVAINALIKFYYYKIEYDEKSIETNKTVGATHFLTIFFSKNLIISFSMLMPEIFFFCLLHFYFIENVNYSVLIFLLSALMNSRIAGLMLQDFIKYDSDKYNLLMVQHMKKLVVPIFLTVFILFLQSGIMNYFITGMLDVKIILISFLMSSMLTFCSLICNYLFSKKKPLLIGVNSMIACLFIGISMHLFLNNALILSYLTPTIYVLSAIFIIFKLQKFSHLFIQNIVYLKKSFLYLVKIKKYNSIYEINLDQFNYYHPKISKILDVYVKNGKPILINTSHRIFLALPKDEINPEILFYCKSVIKHASVDLFPLLDKIENLEQEIKQFKNLNPYNIKVLFNGLVKGHANFRKRLIK